MEAQKTAVQWLKDKLFELEIKIDSKTYEETFFLFEEAKKMEFDQHGLTFARGYMTGYAGANGHGYVDFDKYYEKEYGK